MKKLLLVLAVIVLVQTANATGFDFCIGPKLGYQTATLSFKKADIKSSYKSNMTAGLFARLTVRDFIIQPEVLWFKSGKVFDFNVDPTLNTSGVALNPTVTLTQQNLAVPIFLGYQLDAGLLKVRGNVGPVMYFVLSQKQDVDGNGQRVDVDNLETENMTWGAAFNVGLDVWKVTLDINYSFGLTNMFGTDNVEWSFNGDKGNIHLNDMTQNMFTVTLGLKLL